MRGSVIKRGKTWSYVVYLGRDDSGRKRQKWKGGFATKRQAEDALTEMLERLRVGTYVDAGRMTVREYCDEWLRAISPGLRPTTSASYRATLERLLLPRIGHIKLTQLTPVNITRLNHELLESGRQDGKGGLSPTSVVYAHRILKHALTDAVRGGAIARNPAALVTPPRKVEKEMRVWTAAEARRFLEAVADERLYAMWLLLVMTGMRRGEVLGLRWHDVDLDLGRLAIRQTLVEVHYELVVSEPKTRRSRRSISLDPASVDVLREHRERQEAERLPLVQPSDRFGELVFQSIDGRPLQPQNVSQTFSNTIRRLGLPPIRLHDLRHTSATLALAAGIHPKVVSERLGHSSIAITLDTYSHVIPGLQESAASELASLILGTPAPATG